MTSMVIDYLYKILGLVVTGFIAPQVYKYIRTKVSLAVLLKVQKYASMIWNDLDEKGRLGDLVETKLASFEKAMQVRFPKLTDADILLLNKDLAGVANAGKEVVKELEATEATATTVTTYVDKDGNELVPKVLPVA